MNFDDPLSCYEAIGNALVQAITERWEKIYVEAVLDGSSVDLLVNYEKGGGGKGNVPYVPMLARYFHELAKLVSDEEKGLYKKCHFVLSSDGNFDVNFEY